MAQLPTQSSVTPPTVPPQLPTQSSVAPPKVQSGFQPQGETLAPALTDSSTEQQSPVTSRCSTASPPPPSLRYVAKSPLVCLFPLLACLIIIVTTVSPISCPGLALVFDILLRSLFRMMLLYQKANILLMFQNVINILSLPALKIING